MAFNVLIPAEVANQEGMRRFIHSMQVANLMESCGSKGVVALEAKYKDLRGRDGVVLDGVFLAKYEEPDKPIFLVKPTPSIGSGCHLYEAVPITMESSLGWRNAEVPVWEIVQ